MSPRIRIHQIAHAIHTAEEHAHLKDQLRTTQDTLTEAQALLTAAQEATAAAEAARAALQAQIAQAAAIATAGTAPLADQVNAALIPRPAGSGWSIRESMQVTKPEYGEIQVRTFPNISAVLVSEQSAVIAHHSEPCHTGDLGLD